MKKWVTTLTVGVLIAAAPLAAQTTINFDGVAEGTNIDTYYQGQGVTFSCASGIDCVDGFVSVMEPPGDSPTEPSSPPNIVTTSYDLQFQGCFDDETAIVRAAFEEPVSFVSIVALNESDEDNAFLAAYAADDTELDFDGRLDFTGGSVILSVQAANIAYVEFSGWQDDGACFDDLTFGQPVPTLPTATLAALVFLMALCGLYLLIRRSRVTN
jgi:hypothetical protein